MLNLTRRLAGVAVASALAVGLGACATQPLPRAVGTTVPAPSMPAATVRATTAEPTPAAPTITRPSETPTAAASTVTTTRPAQPTASAAPASSAPVVVVPADGPVPTGWVDCAAVRCVALTFDDGPNTGTTVQIIDALTKAGAPATFFMLGSMAQNNPAIVARIAANPRFEIGNHTVSHPNLNTLGAGAVNAQINNGAATLKGLSGRPVTLFRPPYGHHNATVDAACRAAGQALIIWDVDTEDWKNRNTATTTARAVGGARAGSIILMHDIHPSTAAAVPGIVAQLRAKGFVLVTVSELLGRPAPGVTYLRRG